jgi:hypothetical protein
LAQLKAKNKEIQLRLTNLSADVERLKARDAQRSLADATNHALAKISVSLHQYFGSGSRPVQIGNVLPDPNLDRHHRFAGISTARNLMRIRIRSLFSKKIVKISSKLGVPELESAD